MMIKTFDDLFKKLRIDGRCSDVPKGRLEKIQKRLPGQYGQEKAEESVSWLLGYLFCLVDEGYLSGEEVTCLQDHVIDTWYRQV